VDIKEAGALLYWCEGSKRERDCRVEFVNSDPQFVSIFMRYIRAMGIDEKRLRLRMEIHTQDAEQSCRKYWKGIIVASDSNFIATSVRTTSIIRKPLPYGTITIRYNSLAFLQTIKKEILELAERLSRC
jgi:hypothetical protein